MEKLLIKIVQRCSRNVGDSELTIPGTLQNILNHEELAVIPEDRDQRLRPERVLGNPRGAQSRQQVYLHIERLFCS